MEASIWRRARTPDKALPCRWWTSVTVAGGSGGRCPRALLAGPLVPIGPAPLNVGVLSRMGEGED